MICNWLIINSCARHSISCARLSTYVRFCPRTATLYCWRWFYSLQFELARPNYMNRKIETKKTLVKVMHRKLVFVKVESIVIELSESVHWSRGCYAISFISVWNELYRDPNEQLNKRHPVQHTLSKKSSSSHWRGTVVLESK